MRPMTRRLIVPGLVVLMIGSYFAAFEVTGAASTVLRIASAVFFVASVVAFNLLVTRRRRPRGPARPR